MRRAGALLVVLAACRPAEPRPAPTPGNRPTEPIVAAPVDAGVDAPTPCVATCVEARQMLAIGIDQITRSCEAKCAAQR